MALSRYLYRIKKPLSEIWQSSHWADVLRLKKLDHYYTMINFDACESHMWLKIHTQTFYFTMHNHSKSMYSVFGH